jgi:hypothetical protein
MSLSYFDSYGYMKKLVVIRSVKITEGEFEMKFGLSGIEGEFTLQNKNRIKYFEFDAIGNLSTTSTLYEHIQNKILESLEPVQDTIDEFETRIDALEGVLDPRIYRTGTLSVNGQIVSIPITSGKSCKITGTVLLNDTGYIDFEVLCKCIAGTASVTLWNLDYSNAGTRTLVFGSSANEVSIELNTSVLTKYKLGYDLNYLEL